MAGCPTHEQLGSFLAGSLGGAEEEAVCGHVEGCHQCQRTLDWLVGTPPAGRVLRAPVPVPNEQFLERLKAVSPVSGWSAPSWGTPTRDTAAPPSVRDLSVLL